MKPLTKTLKTLITEHGLDILKQEQRLKAMLADLLPHDKQMRFLLELSLRAQIPQKLIAQQNETRVGWEAQIKSMKHYFKDEYFLEDKAVNSVFDCWVEVLPRKVKVVAPPKLVKLSTVSRFEDIEPLDSYLLTIPQMIEKRDYFYNLNDTNYMKFLYDISVIKAANHKDSYPILQLPLSLRNEVAKVLPRPLHKEKYFSDFQQKPFTPEEIKYVNSFPKSHTGTVVNDLIKRKALKREKDITENEKLIEENKITEALNNDYTKTLTLKFILEQGNKLEFQLYVLTAPNSPRIPEKAKLPLLSEDEKLFKKEFKDMIPVVRMAFIGIICGLLFKYLLSVGGVFYYILFWPLVIGSVVGFFYGILSITPLYSLMKDLFDKTKRKERLLAKQERLKIEHEHEQKYQIELDNYNNVLLPQYENDNKDYKNKIDQQIKDLNEKFPLIARQIWLQAMVSNSNVVSTGNSSSTGIGEPKLVARLALLYPKNLHVNTKVLNLQSDIILNFNDKICINIEVDEPHNTATRQETHFIGSNDEKRDCVFTDNNWFVLRFTESQVSHALSECIAIVQELVKFTESGNTHHLINLTQLSKGIETLCWSKEEARLMAMNEE